MGVPLLDYVPLRFLAIKKPMRFRVMSLTDKSREVMIAPVGKKSREVMIALTGKKSR